MWSFLSFVKSLKEVFGLKAQGPSHRHKKPKRVNQKKNTAKKRKSAQKLDKKVRCRSVLQRSSIKKISSLSPARKRLKAKRQGVPTPVLIGEVTHYFNKIEVCVLKILKESIKLGDQIQFQGAQTNFTQKVSSLQVESQNVSSARRGQLVGMKVEAVVRAHDRVYRVTL